MIHLNTDTNSLMTDEMMAELIRLSEEETLFERTSGEGYTCQFPFRASGPDIKFEKEFEYELITTVERFLEVTKDMVDVRLAGDTETDGLDHNVHRIVGFSFATGPYKAWYVPIRHQEGQNIEPEIIFPLIDAFHRRNRWLYFNWTFDGLMYHNEDIDTSTWKVTDVRALVYNADTNNNQNNLKWATEWYCRRKVIKFEDVIGDKTITFDLLKPEEGCKYACEDAANTYAVYAFLFPYMIQLCPTVLAMDCRLARAMTEYYLKNRIHFDNETMITLSEELRIEKDKVERDIFKMMGIDMRAPINLNSNDQVEAKLLEMGLDTGLRTETGKMKLDKAALSKMLHPIAKMLIEFSHLEKQLGSYAQKLASAKTGQINYKFFSQKTGRIASGGDADRNPYYFPINYQNLTKPKAAMYRADYFGDDPKNTELILGWKFTQLKKGEEKDLPPDVKVLEGMSNEMNIRRAITVPDRNWQDWYFICLDYAQEELRLIGGFARDPVYLKAFREMEDIYKTVAAEMFGCKISEVNKDMRKKAKIAVLGLNYGGSGYTLHRSSGIPLDECDEVARRYHQTCRTLVEWKIKHVQRMQQEKFIEWTYDMEFQQLSEEYLERRRKAPSVNCLIRTAYGRPRWVGRWFGSPEPRFQKFAQDTVPSHIVQGTGGDVMRLVLCELKEQFFVPLKDDIRFVGCVHDEIDLAVRKEAFHELIPKVQKLMTKQPPGCCVELPVDVEVGYSYGYVFPFAEETPGVWTVK